MSQRTSESGIADYVILPTIVTLIIAVVIWMDNGDYNFGAYFFIWIVLLRMSTSTREYAKVATNLFALLFLAFIIAMATDQGPDVFGFLGACLIMLSLVSPKNVPQIESSDVRKEVQDQIKRDSIKKERENSWRDPHDQSVYLHEKMDREHID